MQLRCRWSCDLIFHLAYLQRYEQEKYFIPVTNLRYSCLCRSIQLNIDFLFQILDPIYPGQELPLPLHLTEAGRMSWRPIGNPYLWSEYYNLSSLLSQESKIGFLKSFVCYPPHASGDPFRCCVSVRNISLHSSSRPRKCGSLHGKGTSKKSVESCDQILLNLDESKKRFVHQLILSTPLIVNNYLPEAVSLTIESGGVSRMAFLSEVCDVISHSWYILI